MALTPEQQAALAEANRRGLLKPEQIGAANELLKRQGAQPLTGEAPTQRLPPQQDAQGVVQMTTARERVPVPETTAIGQVGTGLSEGVANVLGAPVDLMNAGLSLLGIDTEKPFMGSKSIKEDVLEPLGVMEGPPQTTGDRFLRKAGQVVGETVGALAPMLAAGQKVQQGAKVAGKAAGLVPRVVSQNPQGLKRVTDGLTDIVSQMATLDPGKLAAVEMAYAAGAGLGGQAAIEAFPENPELADVLGQLTVSFGLQSTVGLLRTAGSFGRRKLIGLNQEEMRKEIGQMMSEKLGQNFAASEEELGQRIEEIDRLKELFPGFEPTIGETMGQTGGISNQEKTFADKNPLFAQRRKGQLVQSQQAIREGVDQQVPGRPEDIQAFRDEAKKIVTAKNEQFDLMDQQAIDAVERSKELVSNETRRALDAVDARITGMQGRIAERLQGYPEGATQAQRGEIIRSEYLKELNDFREQAKNLYDKVDLANEMIVPGGETLGAIERMIAKRSRFANLPDDWINRIRPGAVNEDQFTFNDLRSLRSELSSDIREATKAGKDQRAKFLGDILEGVEADLRNITNNAELAEKYPNAVENYREASRFYEQGYQRLKASQAGTMRLHAGRHYNQTGESIAKAFLAGETPFEDFINAVGHRPTALSTMREASLANFMESAVDLDGKIIPARAFGWVKRMKDKVGLFRAFPELENELTSLGRLQVEVNQQRKLAEKFERNPALWGMKVGPEGQFLNETLVPQLSADQQKMAEIHRLTTRSRRELDNSAVMAFIGDDANMAAAKVWGSQNPVEKTKEIMAKLKDPAAVRGFQTAMWDEMMRRFEATAIGAFDKPALQANKMKQFLDRNADAMRAMGYGDARIGRMYAALKGNQILAEAGKPVVKGDSGTANRLQSIMMDWGPFLSRLYAGPVGRGLVSWQWIMGERIMRSLASHFRILNNEQVEGLLMEAFFDPKVARDLMLAATSPNLNKLVQKRFMVHLANLGLLDTEDTKAIKERNEAVKARVLSTTEQSLSFTHPAGRTGVQLPSLAGAN